MHVATVTDIKSLHLDELRGIAEPSYRADQITHWLYQKRVNSFAEMTDLPQALRMQLADNFSFDNIDTLRVLGSKDTTQKFLFRLRDGNLIESVLIPASPALYGSPSDRRTICISTQVGCAYGCKFCASGLNGVKGNLTPGQIVEQIYRLNLLLKPADRCITNIVFMGMGEPLANYANVMAAIHVLHDPGCFNIGGRKLTISTVGVPPKMRELAREGLPINLAISLHAPTDVQRGRLVPLNKKYGIHDIIEACQRFPLRKRSRITFEYVLLAGVNDSPHDARTLAKLVAGVKSKVNLIPLNAAPGIPFERPSDAAIDLFARTLADRGIVVSVRKSRGRDIRAACGQLIVEGQRKSGAQQLAVVM